MFDVGMVSQMELIEDDGVSEALSFNHGPDCTCGSVMNIFRDHWEELGCPTLITVTIFPIVKAEANLGVVEGPWNQL